MTREEAIKEILKIMNFTCEDLNREYEEVINKIYNDFENTVCQNCEWFNHTNNECDFLNRKVEPSFFCGYFSQKKSEERKNSFDPNLFNVYSYDY